MDKEFIVKKLKSSKKKLKEDFSISKIGLFGSYSRNTQVKGSDIDIIYELLEGKKLGFKEIYDLELFFKKLFKIEKIDLVNSEYMNPIIESEMMKSVIYV